MSDPCGVLRVFWIFMPGINILMLIQEILSQQSSYPSTGKAIYTAGLPASGKSTLADRLFSSLGFRKIDPDQVHQLFQKRGEPLDYQRAEVQDIPQRKLQRAAAELRNIIIDTTGADASRIAAGKAQLEEQGYQTAMLFVQRDPQQAYHASVRREFATGRKVDPERVFCCTKTFPGQGCKEILPGRGYRTGWFILEEDG
jgi:predicted kinase